MRSPRSPLLETTSQDDKPFVMEKAEEIRLRALYRAFVMRRGSRWSPDAARGLVGSDCAYHLYRNLEGGGDGQ